MSTTPRSDIMRQKTECNKYAFYLHLRTYIIRYSFTSGLIYLGRGVRRAFFIQRCGAQKVTGKSILLCNMSMPYLCSSEGNLTNLRFLFKLVSEHPYTEQYRPIFISKINSYDFWMSTSALTIYNQRLTTVWRKHLVASKKTSRMRAPPRRR